MFEYKGFSDGDRLYQVPEWKKWVEKESIRKKKIQERIAEKAKIKTDEIGLKHPKTGASLILKDDGGIEIFSGDGSGILMEKGRVIVSGEELFLSSASMEFQTLPNNVYMNGEPIGLSASKRKGLSAGVLEEMKATGLKGRGLKDDED